ncbi:MAG: AAA family ATPase [Synechococcaceae cyanobacterium]|nr:AAA family ATPase [Synechococcaceae cyanobacterium]
MNPLIRALQDPAAYAHPVAAVQVIETHISWVLLTGSLAYKIRKPVQFGFVDFSTAARRRWFSYEEVRLNRRLAPDLYLGVVPIHGPAERARMRGEGPVIEVAVQMRQFDQGDLLPAVLDRAALSVPQLEALACDLACFHSGAAIAAADSPHGTPQQVARPALANLDTLSACGPALPELEALRHWSEAQAEALAPRFAERLRQGAVREGHGDLHLGNMVLLRGRVSVFDCLEFSESLRWIDVISDMAFLVMDLRQRGRPDLAGVLLNRWLQETGDYQGLELWRWYLTYRALVRAKVAALRLSQSGPDTPGERIAACGDELRAYLASALDTVQGRSRPQLVICHGASGSGKSHLAARLCRELGWIQLRSDLERRRLFGRASRLLAQPSLAGDPYGPGLRERLYATELRQAAAAALAAGESLLVDATFLEGRQRQLFRSLAARCQAGFSILDCRISLELAERRIARRRQLGGDPSDADSDVLQRQWQAREPLTESEQQHAVVVETAAELSAPAWQALLRRLEAGQVPGAPGA